MRDFDSLNDLPVDLFFFINPKVLGKSSVVKILIWNFLCMSLRPSFLGFEITIFGIVTAVIILITTAIDLSSGVHGSSYLMLLAI